MLRLCFGLLFLGALSAHTQPLQVEAWVKRIPLTEVQAAAPISECIFQQVSITFGPEQFFYLSHTDTLALELLYTAGYTSVWKDSFTEDNYTIIMVDTEESKPIFFITPVTRRRAKHGLVLSATNLCKP